MSLLEPLGVPTFTTLMNSPGETDRRVNVIKAHCAHVCKSPDETPLHGSYTLNKNHFSHELIGNGIRESPPCQLHWIPQGLPAWDLLSLGSGLVPIRDESPKWEP
jgi:hypothetical protein